MPVEPAALAARVKAAVAEVVKKQADAGVDLINDGEMSKPSYATYIKDRLNGFGGSGNTARLRRPIPTALRATRWIPMQSSWNMGTPLSTSAIAW